MRKFRFNGTQIVAIFLPDNGASGRFLLRYSVMLAECCDNMAAKLLCEFGLIASGFPHEAD